MTVKNIKLVGIFVSVIFLVFLMGQTLWQCFDYLRVENKWEATRNDLKAKQSEIAQLKTLLKNFEKERVDFKKLLFDERDVPTFLDEISRLAAKHSVNINNMRTRQFVRVEIPRSIQDAKSDRANMDQRTLDQQRQAKMEEVLTLSAMPIEIKVDGNFLNLAKLMEDLRGYKQLVNVSGVKISSANKYPQLSCEFVIKIYSLKTLDELKVGIR